MATTGTWETLSFDGMQYQLLLPDGYSASQQYPVLLFLHGGGEETLIPQMINPWFNTAAFRTDYPAIVIAPQLVNSSADVTWGGYPIDGDANSAGENQALAILENVLSQYSADRNRVYVTGLSLGGHGTWDLMIKYNAYDGTDGRIFAAGLSLSGAEMGEGVNQLPSAAVVSELQNVPIWAIHGNDGAQAWDEAMAAAEPANSAYRYTENLSLGHDVWDTYYPLPAGQPYYDWMFSQSANVTGGSWTEPLNVTNYSSGTEVKDASTGSILQALPPISTDTLQFLSVEGTRYAQNLASAETLGLDPSQLRDYDGNNLGAANGWELKGLASVRESAPLSYILVNPVNGRWAEVAVGSNGSFNFSNHGQNGDTRVVGIYEDPLIQLGIVAKGGPYDSQARFVSDITADRLAVLGSLPDPDTVGFEDLFFKLTNHSADHHDDVYLRAILWPDGNIQYANYMNTAQFVALMNREGTPSAVYSSWMTKI